MKDFNNLSREKVARVAQGMGGEAFEKLAMLLPEAGVKYGDDTMGQDEAIKNMLSSEEWKAVLCGEKKLVAQEIERLFADKNSRIIPAHVGITSEVCDEETDFYVRYPNKFDYAEIIEFYKRFFHFMSGIKFLGAAAFEDRAEKEKEKLMEDKSIANLLKRALPLPTPHCFVKDYGTSLEGIFIPAAKLAYDYHFRNRTFKNYCASEKMTERVQIADAGHRKFINMMAAGPNMVWYCPNSMQGYSIEASREAMKVLSKKSLALSGAIEPLLGLIGYPEEMFRLRTTPEYTCAGVYLKSFNPLLACSASDEDFELKILSDKILPKPFDYRSAGLTFIR